MRHPEIELFKQQQAKQAWKKRTALQGIISEAFRAVARSIENSVKEASGDDLIVEFSVTARLNDRTKLIEDNNRVQIYPNYTAQQDSNGCGIAVLAMLTNASYKAVREEFVPEYIKKGMTEWAMNAYLAEHGYAVLVKHPHYMPSKKHRKIWPPEPFAPIHYCCMVTKTNQHHYVLMLSNGSILDPAQDAIMKTFNDYEGVQYVAGVIKLASD